MVSTDSVPSNPTWDCSPIDNFAGIPVDSLDRLSGMDINMSSMEIYDNFVDDLLANPSAFDDILGLYADLFDFQSDDNC